MAVVTVSMPSASKTASNVRVNLLSRSLIGYRTVAPASWRSMTTFLAAWVAQSAVGWAVAVRGGVGGRAEDADAAVGMLDDGEDMKGRAVQGSDGEEVTGRDRVGLAAQERGPGLVVAFGRRLDPVRPEDLPDRGGCRLDAGYGEFAVDAPIPPRSCSRGPSAGRGPGYCDGSVAFQTACDGRRQRGDGV
jgi:hypothetical protein